MRSTRPAALKWRHFHGEVILQCVRWYCKYGISYRYLEEMMAERGLEIDHTAQIPLIEAKDYCPVIFYFHL